MDIKKCLAVVTICALFGALVMAQDANQAAPEMSKAQKNEIIKQFSCTAQVDGIKLSFVLLTNKTVEALFSGTSRYAMRARANATTTLYVQGVPSTDLHFNPKFIIEQNGKTFVGEPVNIHKLAADANANIIFPSYRYITKDLVVKAQKHGLTVYPWAIDDEKIFNKFASLGVDGIVTNKLIGKK